MSFTFDERNNMKKLPLFSLLVIFLVSFSEAQDQVKPDHFTYKADGSVKTRGVYETNENGRVVKFTVLDESDEVLYTEIPYYAEDGRIIRADRFDAKGELEKVVIYFEEFAKVMNAQGEIIDTQGFSQREFLESTNER
ncbi:hypothetical protein [Pelagicoccus sp. SDUM812003]|uniref:hypothetical protein n=1 Tax=Pelagicoccus sp. SDUM812003 TaxID=3041267 RepID=UPI00280D75D7|nr:hypothetical protein [Pelagicoccus sp. SDUM812003]MDQ8205784.1 hypothetical protein [Pelagicoccus sp. SDUM812003]